MRSSKRKFRHTEGSTDLPARKGIPSAGRFSFLLLLLFCFSPQCSVVTQGRLKGRSGAPPVQLGVRSDSLDTPDRCAGNSAHSSDVVESRSRRRFSISAAECACRKYPATGSTAWIAPERLRHRRVQVQARRQGGHRSARPLFAQDSARPRFQSVKRKQARLNQNESSKPISRAHAGALRHPAAMIRRS